MRLDRDPVLHLHRLADEARRVDRPPDRGRQIYPRAGVPQAAPGSVTGHAGKAKAQGRQPSDTVTC